MPFDPQSVAFLRLLQDHLLGPVPEDKDARDAEADRIMLAALSEEERTLVGASMDHVPVPTPHESETGYSILSDLAEEIVSALSEDFVLPDPPLVGTLPLRWPTSVLVRVPDSAKHLAVVDIEFTTFANLLAKACAQALLPPADMS